MGHSIADNLAKCESDVNLGLVGVGSGLDIHRLNQINSVHHHGHVHHTHSAGTHHSRHHLHSTSHVTSSSSHSSLGLGGSSSMSSSHYGPTSELAASFRPLLLCLKMAGLNLTPSGGENRIIVSIFIICYLHNLACQVFLMSVGAASDALFNLFSCFKLR